MTPRLEQASQTASKYQPTILCEAVTTNIMTEKKQDKKNTSSILIPEAVICISLFFNSLSALLKLMACAQFEFVFLCVFIHCLQVSTFESFIQTSQQNRHSNQTIMQEMIQVSTPSSYAVLALVSPSIRTIQHCGSRTHHYNLHVKSFERSVLKSFIDLFLILGHLLVVPHCTLRQKPQLLMLI